MRSSTPRSFESIGSRPSRSRRAFSDPKPCSSNFGVTEDTWRAAQQDENFAESESPLFLGRGIAALAADPRLRDHSGEVTSSWELAARYGVVDSDGSRRDWGAHFRKIAPGYKALRDEYRREARWLERLAERARVYGST